MEKINGRSPSAKNSAKNGEERRRMTKNSREKKRKTAKNSPKNTGLGARKTLRRND
jgi:hypothetical protein